MSLSEHDQHADDLRRETFKPQSDRPGDPTVAAAAAALTGEILSEDRVAVEFIRRHGAKVRYDHSIGSWFIFDGQRWRQDKTRRAFAWARDLARELSIDEAPGTKRGAGRAAFAKGVEEHASRDQGVALVTDDWDRDLYVLGTPGGTVDLRTGETRPSNPKDHITKTTAVAPASFTDCPRWTLFLDEATGGDDELMRFLQQWAGYNLTGSTQEQSLAFLYGPGGNGKSVFANIVGGVMGDYAKVAGLETFTASPHERHPEELAALAGARMVSASETEAGKRWAEARVKSLTGGETIRARFMRQNSFEFRPQFKLTVLGNYAPAITNLDDAIRRRFLIIPFTRKPAHPDPTLEEQLRTEWPGILRWMIDGCLDWQRNGLCKPASVLAATQDYFADQDVFGQFLDERCDVDRDDTNKFEGKVVLFNAWADYAKAAGEPPGTGKTFKESMRRRGFPEPMQIKAIRTKGYRGIRLNSLDDYGRDGGGR
jgi:putative DNA primase/helicase